MGQMEDFPPSVGSVIGNMTIQTWVISSKTIHPADTKVSTFDPGKGGFQGAAEWLSSTIKSFKPDV